MTNGVPTNQSAHNYPTVLTTESLEGGNEDVVDANVNVVNAMYEELLDTDEISPAALRSYYVDFYLTQALAGGFAQYVFTAPNATKSTPTSARASAAMGATAHLELFNRTVAAFDALSEDDVEQLPRRRQSWTAEGDTEGDEPDGVSDAVRRIEELDGEFESLLETEDISALNAAWLLGQEDLLVLDDDELDAHIAGRVARLPRPRGAPGGSRRGSPGGRAGVRSQIIRELCDIAGHALERITMGDPNYEHNGETTLAWHFTTEHGDFLMVEDDDEAFMINPETQEILAAVEFEEAVQFEETVEFEEARP